MGRMRLILRISMRFQSTKVIQLFSRTISLPSTKNSLIQEGLLK